MNVVGTASRVRSFKDLTVWQEAIKLAKAVYRLTAGFPKEERYGLSQQMRWAAISIPSNIAEGQARGHRAEYRQFLYVSLGSLAELETQLVLAEQLSLVASTQSLLEVVKRLHTMLLRLTRSL